MNDIVNGNTHITPLVDGAWLARHLEDTNIAVVGILSRHAVDGGVAEKIPGARALHWKELLWDDRQRQFVGAVTLKQRLRDAGVDTERHLVLYGEPTQFGFYARWALLRAGISRVSVLNGGLKAWRAENRPLEALSGTHVTLAAADGDLQAPARAASDIRIGRDQLLQRLGDDNLQILDIRTLEEYDGERVGPEGGNHGAERAGHIPGARLFPFTSLLDHDSRILPLEQLRALAVDAGLDPLRETAVYCRLSHRSTLAFFVLTELLGFRHVRVYDGSWTEWGSLVGAPIER